MSGSRLLKAAALAAAMALPSVAFAGSDTLSSSDGLSLSPLLGTSAQQTDASSVDSQNAPAPTRVAMESNGPVGGTHPVYFDAPEEKPNIHGFVEFPFKTAYVTPRGLVVENAGLVMQPVAGLVFPLGDVGPVTGLAFITGVWNSINTNQHDPFVGPWNELDYFASLSGNVGKFSGTLTYSPWFSPPHAFRIESTADFKLSYDDTGLLGPDIAIKPYVDFFYSISGDSTVILGRHGSTYYFEIGIQPTYTWKGIASYPLTFSFPTYISVGPENYWSAGGGNGNAGVFSSAINVSVPLAFIPARYGFWHADAGLQYFYLINNALLQAGTIASGNDNHNVLNASVGIGVNF